MSVYLKSIELSGFKSFAGKTRLEFNAPVTGIVGPNGSGKSNVVESIKWVLGEQSAKSLRGEKMEDVIFNGSRERSALGMAEVSLRFNNENHWLPIDYNEVSISRRIFRSGESQYFMNKSRVRLKDTIELFLDTGVGHDSYAIFGQGKIDRLLSESPMERRILFEDFAGISKFKYRKDEAERKLTRSQENLERVNDLIIELEKEVKSLKKQAEDANKYNELREKLKELEIKFEALRVRNVQREIENRQKKIDDLHAKQLPLNGELSEREVALHKTEEDIRLREEEISRLDNEFIALENNMAESKSRLRGAEERQQAIRENLESMEKRLAGEKEHTARLKQELEEKQKDLEIAESENKKYSEEMREIQLKIDKVFDSIKTLDADILEQSRTLGFERIVSKDDMEKIRRDIITHHTRLENFRELLKEKWEQIRALEKDKTQKEEHRESLAQEMRVLKEQLNDVIQEIEEKLSREEELKNDSQTKSAEIRNLQKELKSMDKVIMESLEKQSDQLKAFSRKKPMLESRIENTLLRLQQAVDGSGESAKEIVADLKKLIDDYKGYYENILGILYSDEGTYTRKEKIQNRIEELGDEIVANETELERLSARMKELQVSRSDIQTTYNKIEYNMNGLDREVKQASKQLDEWTGARKGLDNQINATSDMLQKKQNQMDKIEQIVKDYEEKIRVHREEKNRHFEKLNVKKIDFARSEEKVKSIRNEVRRINQQIADIERNREDYTKESERAEQKLSELGTLIENERVALNSFNEQKEKMSREISEKKEILGKLRQSVKAIENQLKDLGLKLQKMELSITSLEEQIRERKSSLNIIVQNTQNTYGNDVRDFVLDENDNLDEIAVETRKVRNSLSRLGDVNLLAIEQYRDAKERLDFLINQRRDIETAMSDIVDLINETNQKSQEQFLRAFEDIRKAFKKIFSRLFGGGRADLRLSNKDNILNSGIEIMAEPPGKKFQNVTLLSGGERALVAIAVIFSILYLKPTPFVVLDELDAPLDDENIERFKKLLEDFKESCQFIIVSHSKSTLEICDTLYGVTMEELGVSKVINVAFDESDVLFKEETADGSA